MTDPVDTDALRRDARVLAPGFSGVEKRLNAAAAELDRLRAVVENAPHEPPCPARLPATFTQPMPCTCWKAEAL